LYQIPKLPAKSIGFSLSDLKTEVTQIMAELSKLKEQGLVKLAPIFNSSIDDIIEDGINQVGVYHFDKVIRKKKNDIIGTDDLKLLYYYHNKMIQYELPLYFEKNMI